MRAAPCAAAAHSRKDRPGCAARPRSPAVTLPGGTAPSPCGGGRARRTRRGGTTAGICFMPRLLPRPATRRPGRHRAKVKIAALETHGHGESAAPPINPTPPPISPLPMRGSWARACWRRCAHRARPGAPVRDGFCPVRHGPARSRRRPAASSAETPAQAAGKKIPAGLRRRRRRTAEQNFEIARDCLAVARARASGAGPGWKVAHAAY